MNQIEKPEEIDISGIKRICKKCSTEKPLVEFTKQKSNKYGRTYVCYDCHKQWQKEYYKTHKQNFRRYQKKYDDGHEDERKEYEKMYYKEHKDEYAIRGKKQRQKPICKEYQKRYVEENKELISVRQKEYRKKNKKREIARSVKWRRNKRKTDVGFRILDNIRRRINYAIKNNAKSAHTKELIDCTIEFLKEHLQQTAMKNGYLNFDINNYSGKEYHIDHIIPCSAFNFRCSYHQRLCFNWSNLQILEGPENLSKSATVDFSLVEEFKPILRKVA